MSGRFHKYCKAVVSNIYVAWVLQGACDIIPKAPRRHIISQQVLLHQPAVNFFSLLLLLWWIKHTSINSCYWLCNSCYYVFVHLTKHKSKITTIWDTMNFFFVLRSGLPTQKSWKPLVYRPFILTAVYSRSVHSSMYRLPVHTAVYRLPAHTAVYRSSVHTAGIWMFVVTNPASAYRQCGKSWNNPRPSFKHRTSPIPVLNITAAQFWHLIIQCW